MDLQQLDASDTQQDMAAEARLLSAACRLFCREGIHATGVARLLKEAKVARRTLYVRYGSKENVLRAVFENEAQMWYRWFDDELPQRAPNVRSQMLALFDVLHEWFGSGSFFGCIFVNAVAEHDKDGSWVQGLAAQHRVNVDRRLLKLARDAGADDAHLLTDKLSLVIDGAIVTAMVTGDPGAALVAKSTAEDILASSGISAGRKRAKARATSA